MDNIEDVDAMVGWLAEVPSLRPHGFAISETQFHVFIINASRRLFSDRFFTSSFRPEFYTSLGREWVMNNGPGGKQYEPGASNGHENQEVSPMKRILRTTLAAMGLLAVSLFGMTGCKGPERAPRQPVSGVDSPPLHETGSRPSK